MEIIVKIAFTFNAVVYIDIFFPDKVMNTMEMIHMEITFFPDQDKLVQKIAWTKSVQI